MIETLTYKNPARWLKFNMKTLMVVMLLVAFAFGWLGPVIQRRRDQQNAVKAIRNLGGFVEYAEPSALVHEFGWLCAAFGDELLLDVKVVSLAGLPVSDADLVHLEGLMQLEELSLCETHVTDLGFVHLTGLTSLRRLYFGRTQVTGAGFVHLKGMTQLEFLIADDNPLTDASLTHLKGLPQLRKLSLVMTPLTDASVVYLKEMKQLDELNLFGVYGIGNESWQDLRVNLATTIISVHTGPKKPDIDLFNASRGHE